jgi:hypothetical protein
MNKETEYLLKKLIELPEEERAEVITALFEQISQESLTEMTFGPLNKPCKYCGKSLSN